MSYEGTMDDEDVLQTRQLQRMRRIATGFLFGAAFLFVLTALVPDPPQWVRLIHAGAEAGMVGGLADWFAVTALFRHPLGIPIPHTALIPRNKNSLGEGLGRFVERHFIQPELVHAKLAEVDVAQTLGDWLAKPDNARTVADQILPAVPYVLNGLDDKQITGFMHKSLRERMKSLPMGPVLARGLAVLRENEADLKVFDKALALVRDYLNDNEDKITTMIGQRSRWFVPASVDQKVAEGLIWAVLETVNELGRPDNTLRLTFREEIGAAAEQLESEPGAGESVDELRDALLDSPDLEVAMIRIWEEIRKTVLEEAAHDDPAVAEALAEGIAKVGTHIAEDPDLRAKINARVEDFVTAIVLPWRHKIGTYIAEVVHRWDGKTMSERLERAVGRDLQFIRINGTLVGAGVGCALFGIAEWLK